MDQALLFGKNLCKISKILRTSDFKPVFHNMVTLKKFTTPLKGEIHDVEWSGVYTLECGDCSGVYIGETGRIIENPKIKKKMQLYGVLLERDLSQ